MGMNYSPSKQDIQQWMAMTDTNSDGKVTLDEYEALLLKSLKMAGFKVENDQIAF